MGRDFSGVCVSVCLFVCLSVCLFLLHAISLQLGSPNLTQKCSAACPGNPFILGSKGQGRGHETKNIAGVGQGAYVSAGFFYSNASSIE